MDNKKILVVYYSRTGTTKMAGEAIAKKLGSDLEEIIDKTDRKGAVGWVLAGRDAMKKSLTEIVEPKKNPAQYDLVIIGTPVWAGTMAPAVRTYLSIHKDMIAQAAFFCTMGGSGNKNIFTYLEEASSKKPVATVALQTKEVRTGNVEGRIEKFAQEIG
jgi:flavodoxin